MMKSAFLVIALAACGGGKSKPAAPPMDPPTTPTETAAPTEGAEAKPAEPAPPPGPSEEMLAQAALAEQYELGKKVYTEKKCASCHGDKGEGNPKNPAVIGDKAFPEKAAKTAKLRKGVMFKTAKDVLDFVKKNMPAKEPGTLTDDEAAAVTAWLLSESKKNVTAKLDASNAASINLR